MNAETCVRFAEKSVGNVGQCDILQQVTLDMRLYENLMAMPKTRIKIKD